MSNKKNNTKAQTSKKKSNKKLLITIVSVVALVAVAVGIWLLAKPQEKVDDGTKGITVSVLHKNDTMWATTFYTTREFLGEALEDRGLVRPQDSENGVVHTVRGEKVEENAAWKLYINAEEATTGIYETPLVAGSDYRLEYTIVD